MEWFYGLIAVLIVIIVLDQTSRKGHFDFIGKYLREVWMGLLAVYTVALARNQSVREVTYSGAAPASENWTWHEQVSGPAWGRGGRLVRNVVQPTLTVFMPPNRARSTHAAVVIAPGGAFEWLEIDGEG